MKRSIASWEVTEMAALYRYRGLDEQGAFLKGYISGTSSKEALSFLHRRHIEPLSLRRHWHLKSDPQNLKLFFLYLEYALKAGYALAPALGLICGSFGGFFRDIIGELHEKVCQGHLLSDACSEYPMIFSSPLINLIKTGEQSGRFMAICRQAYLYLTKSQLQKHHLLKAVAHPLLNFVFLVLACGIMMAWLLPEVHMLLQEKNQPLPFATWFLVRLHTFSLEMVGIYGGVGLVFFLGLKKWGKSLLFKVAGQFMAKKQYLSFFTALSLLVQERMRFISALVIACETVDSPFLKKRLEQVVADIQEGKKLAQALSQLPYLSSFYIQLLQAGEATGRQAEALEVMTEALGEEIRQWNERLTFWISPVLMVILGMCFWFLIEGTLLPLYDAMKEFPHGA